MVESASIESPKLRWLHSFNRCSSWGIVQKSKLTKGLTWHVVFQICWLLACFKHLCASKLAGFNNIQIVSRVALVDNLSADFEFDFLHSSEDDLKLIGVEVAEHKCLAKACAKVICQFLALLVERCLKLLLFIPVAKSFSTDRGTWSSFGSLCLDLIDREVKHVIVVATFRGLI